MPRAKSVHYTLRPPDVAVLPPRDQAFHDIRSLPLSEELSLPLVPRYAALEALWQECAQGTGFIDGMQHLHSHGTDADCVVIPLLKFVKEHCSTDLSKRQKYLSIFEKVIFVLEAVLATLPPTNTLRRPFKEFALNPGPLCELKRSFWSTVVYKHFPSLVGARI
jgi:hypothetical protein